MDSRHQLLLTHEAAKLARNSPRTIRRWKQQGRLRAYRSHPGRGGVLLFRREDVLACLGIVEEVGGAHQISGAAAASHLPPQAAGEGGEVVL